MREDPAITQRETLRRGTVALLFVFYILLLAEGPLRKWLLPGASNALVFVRDPVMLAILVAYAGLTPSPAMRRLLVLYAATLAILVACATAQVATSALPALVILAGLRNTLLFVPLCCAIHDAFAPPDLARWVRLNLWLAPPIALLVIAQYHSGPAAWINAVPGGSDDGVFMLVEDVVRPYGLFSFTLGHSAFAAWMLGTVLAAMMARRTLGVSRFLVGFGAFGVLAMGLFSGSRTFYLFAACVCLVFAGAAVTFGAPSQRRAAGAVIAAMVLASAAILVVAPSVAGDLLDRQATASASEGATSERVGHVLTDFVDELGRAPALGLGLGAGTNIANYLSNGRTDHVLAEYELTRIVQELGPFFGLALILLRWSLLVWFAALAWRAARARNLQPACYLGFLAPVFLAHDISLQNSMIGIAWFAAGVFLSSVRLGAPARGPRRCA